MSVVISVHLPVHLYDPLLCGLILFFDFLLLFSFVIFSVLLFLAEGKLNVLHGSAMPVQGKAVLLCPLKGKVQHWTFDLCKSHNSDACLGSLK